MVVVREQEKCQICGEPYKAIHAEHAVEFIGDSFIKWDIEGHVCANPTTHQDGIVQTPFCVIAEPGNEAKEEEAFDGSVQFELDFGDRFIRVNCPDKDDEIHLLIKRNSRYCGISLDLDQAEQLAKYILGHVNNARLANPD